MTLRLRQIRSLTMRTALSLLVLAYICCLSSSASAETKPTTSQDAPLRYRQIFVPADHLDAWPRDGEKLIPVEAKQLQEWIEQARANAGDEPWREARITSAVYFARLENDRLEGTGEWKFESPADRPTLFALPGASLFVKDAQWQSEPPRAAQLGLWGRSEGDSSEIGLLVSGPGTLKFRWQKDSLVARNEPAAFRLSFPRSLSTRLILDLPEGKEPVVDRGVLVLPSAVENRAPQSQKVPQSGMRRWELAMQGESEAMLRVGDVDQESSSAAATARFHRNAVYRLSPRGIDVTFTLGVESASIPAQFSLQLDEGLQVSSVSLGGREVPWSIAMDASRNRRIVTIDLPASYSGERAIEILAWAPIRIDQSQQLPTVAVQQFTWSTGTIEIVVPDSLELEELTPGDCMERAIAVSKKSKDQILQFDQLSPDARPEIQVGLQAPLLAESQVIVDAEPEVENHSTESTADIEMDATIAEGSVSVVYHIANRQQGGSVDGLLVYLSEPLPDGVAWLDEDTREALSASSDDARREAMNLPETGQLWRVQFPQPKADGSVVVVHADWPVGEALRLPLMMVPQTERQTGRVELLAAENSPWMVRQQGLVPTSLPDSAAESPQPIRAAYRYDPLQVVQQSTAPQFELVQFEGDALPRLVAVRVEMESAYSANGMASHSIQYLLDNRGSSEFEFVLPASVEMSSAWLNGKAVIPQRSTKDETALSVRLNPIDKSPVIRLELIEESVSLGTRHQLLPPLPNAGLPTLSSQWTIWTPTDYTILEGAAHARAPDGWRSRLFGPLGRSSDRAPFNPWNKGDWTRVWNQSQRDEQSIAHVRRLLERIGRKIAAAGEDSRPTWKSLFSGAVEVAAQPDPLVVDFWSLARQGVQPNEPISVVNEMDKAANPSEEEQSADEQVAVALQFLAEHQLSILIAPNRVLFTTTERIAALHPMPQGVALPGVYRTEEDVAEWMALVSPDAWSLAPSSALELLMRISTGPRAMAGWHAFQISMGDPALPATVVARNRHYSWIGGMFLATVGSGFWLRRRFPRFLSGALLVLAVACLVAPTTLLPLVSSALLGVLAALVGTFFWKPLDGSRSVPASFSSGSTILMLSVITGACLAAPGQSAMAQAAAEESEGANEIHSVLIPVDGDGQVAETKRYVSEAFLRQLLARAQRDPSQLGDWLLRSGRYSARLVGDDAAKDASSFWTAEFDVETLVRDAVVRLPLRRADFAESPRAMLDGMPARLVWDPTGGCRVDVAEPGSHRMEIQFVPNLQQEGGISNVRIAIPRLVDAEIQIDGARPPQLEVQGVRVNVATAAQQIRRTLAGSDQLDIRWGSVESTGSEESRWQVDRLLWLRVQSDGIWLDAKLVAVGGGTAPKSLTVEADRRWKLESEGNPIADEATDSDRQGFVIPLPEAKEGRVVLSIRFLIHESAIAGNFSLGELLDPSIPVRNTWIALSAEPSQSASITCDRPVAPVEAADFASLWSDAAETPQIAFQSQVADATWQLAVRPQPRLATVNDRSTLIVDRDQVQVRYEADVAPGLDERFQFSMQTPKQLEVEEVVVDREGQSIPVRWSRPQPDRLNLFFEMPLEDRYHVLVTGHVPFKLEEELPLPAIRASVNASGPQSVSVFRDDRVLVEVIGGAQSTEAAVVAMAPPGPSHRFVGSVSLGGMTESPRLRVVPNYVAISGESLTTIGESDGEWTATYVYQLRVEKGTLGKLILTAPKSWVGPFVSNPATDVTVTETDPANIQLAIRLPQPLKAGQKMELQIDSSLAPIPDEPFTAPMIRLEGHDNVASFIAVPSEVNRQSLEWQSRGMTTATLPPAWQSEEYQSGRFVYRVIDRSGEIKLRPVVQRSASSSISLAETSVLVGPDGSQSSNTQFALRPEGIAECTLRIPKGYELVDVMVSGRRPLIRPVEGTTWQIALGPPYLAQLLEVTLQAPASVVDDPSTFTARRPQLFLGEREIPVEVNLWSIFEQPAAKMGESEFATPLLGADLADLRLAQLLNVAEASAPLALQAPEPDGFRWFRPWADRLLAAADSLQLELTMHSEVPRGEQLVLPNEPPPGEAIQRARDWVARMLQELAPDASTLMRSSDGIESGSDPLLMFPLSSGLRGNYFVADGSSNALTWIVPEAMA